MNAVFYTADAQSWAESLGDIPWPLLPVANRPLLDYWLEACAEQGIEQVQVILGEDSERVEDFARDGARWGLKISYSFARTSEHPLDYLKSIADRWDEGLLFIGAPFFLRHRKAFTPAGFETLDACLHEHDGQIQFLFGKSGAEVKALLAGEPGSRTGLEQIHIHPFTIDSTAAYFDLNMKMVAGEFPRYVTAGFLDSDHSSIGYNVLTLPSAQLRAPILVGNDCRFAAMTTIGPKAVIGDHVIVDSRSELENCLILQDTYIGQNLEIKNKIVSGNRLVNPEDGTSIEIDDSWLVARNRPDMRTEDLVRYIVLWFLGFGVALAQLVPFCILYPVVRAVRIGKYFDEKFHDPRTGYTALPVFRKLKNRRSVAYSLFRALTLDRFPWLLLALRGRLFVCGQPPMRHPEDDEIIHQLKQYYPAVFSYADYCKESDRLTDSLWYAHIRSLFEDVKILIKSLLYRFFRAGR
ncbi:sugar phosphate nucleotidyltransferase [Pontiella sulfatireligans]|uniref:UTP--glucose-1-phosphate uridylyltransferase n=1 Tax=Pontiella sulfatireligans TaxID=2750658 RepID=A0A6C2URG1_9BACT|nr:NDP-sugar synthase [Pontiella sulfatireligans]VGO22912.1 UTP--glucose-1-phosphate uridylyltransferase [Pontiella sulfatireligans]